MNKLSLFLLSFLLLATYSCNESTETVEEEVTVEEVVEEVVEAPVVEEVTSELPTFESEELTSFVASYDEFANKTIDMLSEGDFEGIGALEAEGTAISTKAQEVMANASPEDAEKLTAYMVSIQERMAAAAGM